MSKLVLMVFENARIENIGEVLDVSLDDGIMVIHFENGQVAYLKHWWSAMVYPDAIQPNLGSANE